MGEREENNLRNKKKNSIHIYIIINIYMLYIFILCQMLIGIARANFLGFISDFNWVIFNISCPIKKEVQKTGLFVVIQ